MEDVDLGDKFLLLVIVAGIGSAIVIGLVKVGEIIVRRRTAALIDQHSEGRTEEEEDDPPSI